VNCRDFTGAKDEGFVCCTDALHSSPYPYNTHILADFSAMPTVGIAIHDAYMKIRRNLFNNVHPHLEAWTCPPIRTLSTALQIFFWPNVLSDDTNDSVGFESG